jgi:peptide/nickel transport system substrate-binding protein
MRLNLTPFGKLLSLVLLASIASCNNGIEETDATVIPPTPTAAALPTADQVSPGIERDFIVVATDAPNPNFTDFDKFGNVIGFNNDLMARLSAIANFEYEFVVTPHEGVLESIAARSNSDFSAVMSVLVIPETPAEGIAYTNPYLEVGQVLVVLANERALQSHLDIRPGVPIGVEASSSGEQTAIDILQLAPADVHEFETSVHSLQALVDGVVDAVILDSHTAEHFVQAFPEQLKIAGGTGRATWISSKGYGIALSVDSGELLERLNQAIAEAWNDLTIERLTVAWFIPDQSFDAGESRVPTPATELIIGIVGQLSSMDPASDPELIGWEMKNNTMSGLFAFNSNNELVPMLAAELPAISDDKLEYTFPLRQGLRFPDGGELTADDVKWAIDRSAGLGSFLVNSYLKDSDEDNFADQDAVQVINQFTVKILLQEPVAYFLSLLATPPYFPISNECYLETWDLASPCGGIGPYTIVGWESDRIRLKANPGWPGSPAPAFENIHVRFFEEPADVLRSMIDFQSIDIAWTGLPFSDLLELRDTDLEGDGTVDFTSWQGPAVFKSYLIFEQDNPPWNNNNVRQAVAYAVDRNALANNVFDGSRHPLSSPVPDAFPGHVPVLPERNLEQAQALLREEGYDESNTLEITIWYTDDAHYTPLEEVYASAIKAQLEETGIFVVTLASAPWEVYRSQVSQCAYPAYLLGWPTPGQPVNYPDMSSWTDFFVQNTSSGFCSNYESEIMAELVDAAREELDPEIRLELYAQIQQLWAEDLPTLDLTQETRQAIAVNNVGNVRIDAMGLLHYEVLTKGGG